MATLIDDDILAVERVKPKLKNKLPRDYARRGIGPVKLKGLIDLIADIGSMLENNERLPGTRFPE
jgi:type I restriction enzyme M protein